MASDTDTSYMDPLCKNLIDDFNCETKEGEGEHMAVVQDNVSKPQRERMRVYLRIRPFTNSEKHSQEDQGCLELVNEQEVLLTAPRDSFTFKSSIRGIAEQSHKFSFSNVFPQDTSQKSFFDDTMLGYVKDFIHGQNCLIFTYGVTNAGKTYTIQGTPKDGGILPRALDVLFNSISAKLYKKVDLKPKMYNDVVKLTKDQQMYEETLKSVVLNAGEKENVDLSVLLKLNTSVSTKGDVSISSSVSDASMLKKIENMSYDGETTIAEELKNRVSDHTVVDIETQGPIKFSIWVSFAEIYNECVYDLLEPTPTGKGKRRAVLKLGDDKHGNPYIKGLKEVKVDNTDEAFKVLRVGLKNQNVASTKLNQHSSRSHTIFTIKAVRVVDVDQPNVARVSRLQFVDLAGSERYCKTQSKGDRLREAANINTSIMTLGKCIECLRYNQLHMNHPTIIPFRESKLTRLFQGFFLGKGKACMIVNINQCASYFDETYHVLKFSAVAKQVTTKAPRPTEIWKVPDVPKFPYTPGPSSRVNFNTPYALRSTPSIMNTPALRNSSYELATVQDEGMRKVIEDLRSRLIEEKRKNYTMELKVREEVCQEMSEQIVEIENNYNERLQVEQQSLEEQCDKRIELLTKSLKKARKKRKLEQDGDDEYVPSVLLESERLKVKERDETIRQLKQRMSELQRKVDFMDMAKTPEHHSKAIEKLQNQLEEAKETLTVQERHIEELEITVCDEREEKEMALEKLNEVVDDEEESRSNEAKLMEELRELLESTTKELNEARLKLDKRDDIIKNLRTELLRPTDSLIAPDLDQDEIEHLQRQLEILRQQKDFRDEELMEIRKDQSNESNKLKEVQHEMEKMSSQLKESKENSEQLLFEKDELDIKVCRYEEIISNHKTALADSEALIEQLNKQVAAKEKEIELLKNSNDSNYAEEVVELRKQLVAKDNRIVELEQQAGELATKEEELASLKVTCEKLELENSRLTTDEKRENSVSAEANSTEAKQADLVEQLKKEITRLTTENHSLNEERKGMKEISELQGVLTEVEFKIKDYNEKVLLVEQLQSDVKRLSADVEKEKEEKQMLQDDFERNQKLLSDTEQKVTELAEIRTLLIEKEEEVGKLMQKNNFLTLSLADKDSEINFCQRKIEDLETEVKSLKGNALDKQRLEDSLREQESLAEKLTSEITELKESHIAALRVKDQEVKVLQEKATATQPLPVPFRKDVVQPGSPFRAGSNLVRKDQKERLASPGRSPSSPSSRQNFTQIRKLERSLEVANKKVEEKETCLTEKAKKIERLQEQLGCLQGIQTELTSLQEHKTNLEEKIENLEQKDKENGALLVEKEACLRELQEINESQRIYAEKQQLALDQVKAEMEDLRKELTENKQVLIMKQEECSQLEETISKYKGDVQTLEDKHEELHGRMQRASDDAKDLELTVTKLREEKRDLASELTSVKESLFQTRESCRDMKDKLINIERDLDTKSTDLRIKDDHLNRLKDQEKKLKKEIAALVQRHHERSILESENSEKLCECQNNHQEQLRNMSSLERDLKELKDECTKKTEKLELRERTICNQKEKYQQLEQKFQVKEALLEREQKNQDMVFEQQKQINEYEKLIDNHSELMKAQMDELSLLKNQIKDLEDIIKTMENKMIELKKDLQDKVSENDLLREEVNKLRKNIQILEDERKWVEDVEPVFHPDDQKRQEPKSESKDQKEKRSATKRRSSEIPLSELKELCSDKKAKSDNENCQKTRKSSRTTSTSKSGSKLRRAKSAADKENNEENATPKKSKRVLFKVEDKETPEPNVILNTPEECVEPDVKSTTGSRRRRRKLGKKSDFTMSPTLQMSPQRSGTSQATSLIQRQLRSRHK